MSVNRRMFQYIFIVPSFLCGPDTFSLFLHFLFFLSIFLCIKLGKFCLILFLIQWVIRFRSIPYPVKEIILELDFIDDSFAWFHREREGGREDLFKRWSAREIEIERERERGNGREFKDGIGEWNLYHIRLDYLHLPLLGFQNTSRGCFFFCLFSPYPFLLSLSLSLYDSCVSFSIRFISLLEALASSPS